MKEQGIIIQNGRFGYRKKAAELVVLDTVNLNCASGELIGIAGVNGCGKSTLIRSICALQENLGGKIMVSGIPIDSVSANQLAREVSVVLTEKISGFNLTCYDAVAAGRLPYTGMFHRLSEKDKNMVEESMKTLGLQDHRNKLLNELSDGLYQKTMIAKALAQQTPVMLLDEPGAYLDFAGKHELFINLTLLTRDKGKCILVSSHELDLLLKYCKKLILVNEGRAKMIDVSTAMNDETFRKISGGYL